jgi:hypothetical protein
MTLTVRLDAALDSALQRYCEQHGVTKSLVVQESLAAYLLTAAPAPGGQAAARRTPAPSVNHQAFAAAGLIGVVADGGGADKAAVRQRIAERQQRQAGPARPPKP